MFSLRKDTGMDCLLLLFVYNSVAFLCQCCQCFHFRNKWAGTSGLGMFSHWLGAAQDKCGFILNEV